MKSVGIIKKEIKSSINYNIDVMTIDLATVLVCIKKIKANPARYQCQVHICCGPASLPTVFRFELINNNK